MHVLLCAGLILASSVTEPPLRVIHADTELWQAMIRKLSGPEAVASREPMTDGQLAWLTLIRARAPRWEMEIAKLATNYAPAAVGAVTIVAGNGGGQDAFTHDATTIGFDIARLHAEYGDATSAENTARIDRFFRHEYTHLLQKAWLREHPYEAITPLDAALLGIWSEGLGNYESLSERWLGSSETARRTLGELEPRFVTRLAALACTSDEMANALTADLSMGHFDRKWGALPVALWLEREARESPDAIRELVLAGPNGIWNLAERHLDERSRAMLREVQAAAALCGGVTASRSPWP